MTSATPDSVDLTCREIVELVTDYLEGALPLEDRRDFENHLSGCRYCRAYVEQMRATIELTGKPAPEDPPSPFREHLLDSFRDWKRGRP
jgi:anti-sigma factor RsiW